MPVDTCSPSHIPSGDQCVSLSLQMESPVSTPAVLPLHLLVPVVNNDISSPCEQIMVRTRSVGVNTCDVALATEPECLGPCEPGTSVNLEGIVWQETEDGKCHQRAFCSPTMSFWSYGKPFLPTSLLCCLLAFRGLSPHHLGGQDRGPMWKQPLICPAKGVTGQTCVSPTRCVIPLPRQQAEILSCHFSAFLQELTCSGGARGKAVPACTGTRRS